MIQLHTYRWNLSEKSHCKVDQLIHFPVAIPCSALARRCGRWSGDRRGGLSSACKWRPYTVNPADHRGCTIVLPPPKPPKKYWTSTNHPCFTSCLDPDLKKLSKCRPDTGIIPLTSLALLLLARSPVWWCLWMTLGQISRHLMCGPYKKTHWSSQSLLHCLMLLASISRCYRTILEYELDWYYSRFRCVIHHNVAIFSKKNLTLLSWYSTVSHTPVAEVLGRTSFFLTCSLSRRHTSAHSSSTIPPAAFKEPDLLLFSSHENSAQGRRSFANTCRGKRTVFFYGYKWLSLVFQNNHPHFLQFRGHAWSWNMWYHQRSFAMMAIISYWLIVEIKWQW